MIDFILDFWIVIIIVIALIGLIGLAIYFGIQEEEKWQQYIIEHNCKIVGREEGKVNVGVGPTMGGSGGVAVVVVPESDKDIWKCDNEEIIIK